MAVRFRKRAGSVERRNRSDRAVATAPTLSNQLLSLVLDLPRLGGVGGEHAVDPQLVREVLELLDVGLALFGDDHVRCFTLG